MGNFEEQGILAAEYFAIATELRRSQQLHHSSKVHDSIVIDAPTELAAKALDIDPKDVTPQQREAAKSICHVICDNDEIIEVVIGTEKEARKRLKILEDAYKAACHRLCMDFERHYYHLHIDVPFTRGES